MLDAPLSQLIEASERLEPAARAIACARAPVEAARGEDLAGSPVDGSDPRLHRYLCARIGCETGERLHVVWCDGKRGYLGDETIAAGSGGRIEVRVRPLIERALTMGAGGFLLAHNHPSGDCRPSADDLATTRRIAALAAALELDLIDHLVVTRRRIFSMRRGGCL